MQSNNINKVEQFLKALSNGLHGQDLEKYYHRKVIQCEYPNLLTKNLTERDFETIKLASIKGLDVLKSQSYELIKAFEFGDVVIIEAIWKGKLAVPLGKLNVGDEMRAYFAQFYEFKDGLIYRQRNYDCFEPFI
jgi:hypothetical protein